MLVFLCPPPREAFATSVLNRRSISCRLLVLFSGTNDPDVKRINLRFGIEYSPECDLSSLILCRAKTAAHH